MTELNVAADQSDKLLGGEPGIGEGQATRSGRAFQKSFDLNALAFGPGMPEYLAEHREAGNFGEDDPVQCQRIGGEQEFEKAAAQDHQRGTDVAGIEFAHREARKIAFAFAPDHGAEQLFLAGEMGIDGGFRHTRLAGDRVHADGTKSRREKAPLCRSEDAFRLADRRAFLQVDVRHRPVRASRARDPEALLRRPRA